MSRQRNILTILFIVIILLLITGCIVMYSRKEAASKSSGAGATAVEGWIEMPASPERLKGCQVLTHYATLDGKRARNYTCLYDADTYTSYWVAYPICQSHLGTGRTESWGYDTTLGKEVQTKVSSGYGVSLSTSHYAKNSYARGHQIPNADRNGVPEMMAQTYYSTNMTPQIQNGFNGHIWAKLEDAVRSVVPQDDTLYVVTGAAFSKVGEEGSTPVKTIVNKNDRKVLPVPNYYWKVVMKVKRENGMICGADAIGFWLPHDDLKESVYTDFTVSVDQIEEWTGFDFFAAMPLEIQKAAEANSSWAAFKAY